MELHETLQELRRQKGLTQEEVAQALYVSRTAVSKWESGRGTPNIDSLKGIAAFYSVTVDELLSGEELLSLAEEDSRNRADRLRDLVFGLLDVAAALLLFLPVFAQRADGSVQEVSLLSLTGVAPYLRVIYLILVIGSVLLGVATLALQTCRQPLWVRIKSGLSLLVSVGGVLTFIVGLQPYGAVFLLVFLLIKVFILIKGR